MLGLAWTLIAVTPLGAAPPASTSLPSLTPLFGPDAGQAWSVAGGSYVVSREAELPFAARKQPGDSDPCWPVLTAGEGKDLVLNGLANYPAGVEVQLMVRLRGKASADIMVARQPAKADAPKAKKNAEPSLRLLLAGSPANGQVHVSAMENGQPLHDVKILAEKLDWKPSPANHLVYKPQAYTGYSPGWPEDFRARIEHDMGQLPALEDRWINVRVELQKGRVCFWLDDRSVAWKQDDALQVEGKLKLTLGAGVQLAGFAVRPLKDTPGFQPVRLDGYLNGRAFLDSHGVDPASLPPVDEVVTIGGVPLVLPALRYGCDHLDISRSYLREGNMSGYMPSNLHRFAGAAERDPARIQLRVPNAAYEALYVVAAAEDKPDMLPLITAMFYRPGAGFAQSFASRVALATATAGPADVKPLPVRLASGKVVKLWLVRIPLDPGQLSALSDLDVVEIELTKQVRMYRSYPDAINYGWHQAGLPSSVHVYAATLAASPVEFAWNPDTFGHVWQTPAPVKYIATIANRTAEARQGKLTVVTRSYDGSEETRQQKVLALPASIGGKAAAALKVVVPISVKLYGYHDIVATLDVAGRTWMEKRSFVRLAPDTRTPRWTGVGALLGYWSYHGGHYTPHAAQIVRLMTMAGARVTSMHMSEDMSQSDFVRQHLSPPQGGAWSMTASKPKEWAERADFDPAQRSKFQEDFLAHLRKEQQSALPGFAPEQIFLATEPHISSRLTAGNIPEYWSEKPYQLTLVETQQRDKFMRLCQASAEVARKYFPDKKILIPWGDPGFVWPMLRAGFPRNLIDGSGLDCPVDVLPATTVACVHSAYSPSSKTKILRRRIAFRRASTPRTKGLCDKYSIVL